MEHEQKRVVAQESCHARQGIFDGGFSLSREIRVYREDDRSTWCADNIVIRDHTEYGGSVQINIEAAEELIEALRRAIDAHPIVPDVAGMRVRRSYARKLMENAQ